MQEALARDYISVQIKGSNGPNMFKNGQWENVILRTEKELPSTVTNTILVRRGINELEHVPLQLLQPIHVDVKGADAIVIDGELCGKCVKVKTLCEGMAGVIEKGSHLVIQVPVEFLCKYIPGCRRR